MFPTRQQRDLLSESSSVDKELRSSLTELRRAGWCDDDFPDSLRLLEAVGPHIFAPAVSLSLSQKVLGRVLVVGGSIHEVPVVGSFLKGVVREVADQLVNRRMRHANVLDPVNDLEHVMEERLAEPFMQDLRDAIEDIAEATSPDFRGPLYRHARSASLNDALRKLYSIEKRLLEAGRLEEPSDVHYHLTMERAFCLLRIGWEAGRRSRISQRTGFIHREYGPVSDEGPPVLQGGPGQ